MTLDFLSLISPDLVVPSYGIYSLQLVRFARCCTKVYDFHSKTLQIPSKLLTQGYIYHKLRKRLGKFFKTYSKLLSNVGTISFKENITKGIAHSFFYDLICKLMRINEFHLVGLKNS